jgi:hypothetical protein
VALVQIFLLVLRLITLLEVALKAFTLLLVIIKPNKNISSYHLRAVVAKNQAGKK